MSGIHLPDVKRNVDMQNNIVRPISIYSEYVKVTFQKFRAGSRCLCWILHIFNRLLSI